MKIMCPHLSQFPGLNHAFFEANPDILTSAKDQALTAMTGRILPLITLKQVHGIEVLDITELPQEEREADGLVTKLKGIALGILSADCGPVLFYDPIAEVIGACHAGWRGAKNGIIQATITKMENLGAVRSQMYASLGPTIQQMNYEVGPEFPFFFEEPYHSFFIPSQKEGHHYFNLPRYIMQTLFNEKIAHIYDLRQNTFTENFASRRRFLAQDQKQISFCNLSAIAFM